MQTLFFDLETNPTSQAINELGAILGDEILRSKKAEHLDPLIQKADVLCGHNALAHDLPVLQAQRLNPGLWENKPVADTLLLSVWLFPEKPYHHLVKDYQLQGNKLNDPIADSLLARELLQDCVRVFERKPEGEQRFWAALLGGVPGFEGFFKILGMELGPFPKSRAIGFAGQYWEEVICTNQVDLLRLWEDEPIVLAFALSIAQTQNQHSILPPWLLSQYPLTESVLRKLRGENCGQPDCVYCRDALSAQKALSQYFGFPSFRSFDYDQGKPLQEKVVEAGLRNESFLAIFPTGGGKSLTFQLPALIQGKAQRALTVVISPLQALMKDQVDVLESRFNITEAVAINGLLSPLERSHALERVSEGGAHILYLSPEALRSTTIFRLLKKRSIARFVIDEAHCFSAWGQDFRTDYLYIGKFIEKLREAKGLGSGIPVSCFTATAKPQVIEEIKEYFLQRLQLPLSTYQASAARKNLSYYLIEAKGESEKYQHTLKILQASPDSPSIIYVSRTNTAEHLSSRLQSDGLAAVCYHGKLGSEQKKAYQEAFISGEVNTVVATSAFGMGVDKDNVANVIHYEISPSLENYVQEAGRAGRNPSLQANCYVLYNQEDLSKHFQLHRLSKLGFKDIHQIWRGIKQLTQQREKVSKSAMEIAKAAGWDIERDIETKVKSALALLEEQGYLKRGFNRPRVFADSIAVRSVEEGRSRIEQSGIFGEQQKEQAIRVFLALFKKSRKDGELDQVSDALGIPRDQTVTLVRMLKQAKVLGDSKDLSGYLDKSQGKNNSERVFLKYQQLATALGQYLLDLQGESLYLKKANHELQERGCGFSSLERIRQLLRIWKKQGLISLEALRLAPNAFHFKIKEEDQFMLSVQRQFDLSARQLKALIHYEHKEELGNKCLIEFSLLELQGKVGNYYPLEAPQSAVQESPVGLYTGRQLAASSWQKGGPSGKTPTVYQHELSLLLLHHIGALELKDGFLVFYTPLDIERIETNNRIQFKKQDYERLDQFYQHKVEQIHIVGEYARKMLESHRQALAFVNDYFVLPYPDFLKRHFPHIKRKDLQRPMTEEQFRRLTQSLSPEQLEVVKSQEQHAMVVAGPGSGKTRVLVHKIASILQIEDIRPEQFLMLTFSRAAAYEFKQRLYELIGSQAHIVDIYTFHGYAFELLGRMGSLESTEEIIPQAVESIRQGEAPPHKIYAKSMVVVDEFQDIGPEAYELLRAILEEAEEIRSIIVGDDDQNIYEFRGADIEHFRRYSQDFLPKAYALLTNYRSAPNIVDFSDRFVRRLKHRLKPHSLTAHARELGQIRITEYANSRRLFIPLFQELQAQDSIAGSCAVLASTNQDLVRLESLLTAKGIPTRLFFDEKRFHIRDLREMRLFDRFLGEALEQQKENAFISEETWQGAKSRWEKELLNEPDKRMVQKAVEMFERQFQSAPISEWKAYLKEICPEDLRLEEQGAITLSTFHKAKGREFDRVHILLQDYPFHIDERVRVAYVGMTRAKQELHIHTNQPVFRPYESKVKGLDYRVDRREYPHPAEVTLFCSLRDISLSFCGLSAIIPRIEKLRPEDTLSIDEEEQGLVNSQRQQVLRFSKKFLDSKYRDWVAQGYRFQHAHVEHFVYWFEKKEDRELLIPLVRVHFRKGGR